VLAKEHFIDQAWDVVGRKVSKARLLGDIYETARSSIGLPVAIDSPAVTMFRLIIAEGRSLIRQRDAIEQQAHAALADNADYRQLRQIPGIGPIIALTILAEAGDLRRFRHHRQFLKFCGLDLATHHINCGYTSPTRAHKLKCVDNSITVKNSRQYCNVAVGCQLENTQSPDCKTVVIL
jgi:hypothetical protein